MRFKIKLLYRTKQEKKMLIYQRGSMKIGEFKLYLQQHFQVNCPQLFIDEYELYDNDSLTDVLKNEIIIVIETDQQCSQADAQVPLIEVQKNQQINQDNNLKQQSNLHQLNNKKQQQITQKNSNKESQFIQKQKLQIDSNSSSDIEPPKIVQPLSKFNTMTQVTKIPQFTQLKKQPIIKKVTSTEESSSEDQPIKKPQNQNKLNMSIKSPQEELESKQDLWRSTFQRAKSFNQVEQNKIQKEKNLQQESVKIRKVQDSKFVNQENYITFDLELLQINPELLKEQDKIKFKYIYFDAFKMQVAISDVKTGKIIRNNVEQKQIKIQANTELSLSYSELKYLEIDISTMTNDRKQIFQKKDTENVNQNSQEIQQQKNTNPIQEKQNINQDIPDPFAIGAQINYYFGDKNYKKDEYILQHTAKHPEKYMLLNLFLNFPKVKRVIQQEEKLIQIVKQFIQKSKPQEIEFEIMTDGDGNNWIRKKQ